jgi:uncharacterized protein (DUF2147 family)
MKQIKDYPNYLITTDGRIFNLKKMIFLKKLLNNSGYYNICLYNENGGKFYLVHRIMAQTYLPKDDTRNFVNHIDGNKENNFLCNLEWCTHKENMQHAWENGLSKTSEKQRQNGRNTIHIALKAANELKRKKIIDISNGKIYNSSKEAALELGYKKETLANWLNGHRENKTSLKYL